VTRAACWGAIKDITKSLSVIFQSEGYDILNSSIGLSTVKNGFAYNDVVITIASDIDIALSIKANSNNNDRVIVNSRHLIG
jgi:hypothetical protein